jgi:hypothetical protein
MAPSERGLIKAGKIIAWVTIFLFCYLPQADLGGTMVNGTYIITNRLGGLFTFLGYLVGSGFAIASIARSVNFFLVGGSLGILGLLLMLAKFRNTPLTQIKAGAILSLLGFIVLVVLPFLHKARMSERR